MQFRRMVYLTTLLTVSTGGLRLMTSRHIYFIYSILHLSSVKHVNVQYMYILVTQIYVNFFFFSEFEHAPSLKWLQWLGVLYIYM